MVTEILSVTYKAPEGHEVAAAEKLRALGYRCHFGVDRIEVGNAKDGSSIYKGATDLDNGIELKAVLSASSASAIDRQLRSAGKKEGLKLCVIDNGAGVLPDSSCVEEITRKMGKRGVRNVLFIASNGTTKNISG